MVGGKYKKMRKHFSQVYKRCLTEMPSLGNKLLKMENYLNDFLMKWKLSL